MDLSAWYLTTNARDPVHSAHSKGISKVHMPAEQTPVLIPHKRRWPNINQPWSHRKDPLPLGNTPIGLCRGGLLAQVGVEVICIFGGFVVGNQIGHHFS